MKGVLVFDETTDEQPSVIAAGEQEFLLFDSPTLGGELVTPLSQDFLLVEAPQVPQLVTDEGETDVLVLTAGGPPGATGTPGQTGPIGPPGQDGAGVYFETFGFASPSTLWTIVHNRNTMALNVETVDSTGDPIEGNVRFVDNNTIQIDWYYPTAGEARVFR